MWAVKNGIALNEGLRTVNWTQQARNGLGWWNLWALYAS